MKAVRNSQKCVQHIGRRLALALFAVIVLVPFCVAQEGNSQAAPAGAPTSSRSNAHKIIYVSDFDLDAANFKQDKGGITGKGYLLPAPPKSFLRRKRQDPAKEASQLVELMSIALVRDLEKSGFTAMRLSSADPRPTDGVLVTGVFTELNEGNQMRRAFIGFGSGKTKMELYVTATDVSSAGQPLYESSSSKSNGKAPGTLVPLNPYAGAAGFVLKYGMTKNAPEKMVKQTASKIAAELTKQLNSASLIAAQQEPSKQ
jgi:hypothetical protein